MTTEIKPLERIQMLREKTQRRLLDLREPAVRGLRPSQPDVYAVYREQIEHEDELIGMRNGWLIGGQSFLFAAYAAVLIAPTSGTKGSAASQLFTVLPWVGVVLSISAFFTVNAALWRSWELRVNFDRAFLPPEDYPPIMSRRPRWVGHAVAWLVPMLFTVSWVLIICLRSF